MSMECGRCGRPWEEQTVELRCGGRGRPWERAADPQDLGWAKLGPLADTPGYVVHRLLDARGTRCRKLMGRRAGIGTVPRLCRR
jgi:hypothetical protein